MPSPKQKKAERQPELPTLEPDEYCNARKRSGKGYCKKPAGEGTDHLGSGRCKLHGGSMPNHRKAAQTEMAKQGVKAFGLPVNIEPHEALIDELQRTAGIIAFYEIQIRELDDVNQLTGPVGTEGQDAESTLEHHPKAEANIWIRLHIDERKHYVKVAETCIRAGIAERQVQLAEQQGALIANFTRTLLLRLEIDVNKQSVREIVRECLMDISSQVEGSGRELVAAT